MWVKKDMDLGIKRQDTLSLAIMEYIRVFIEVVIMGDVDIGLKRSDTLSLAIM